MRIKLNKGKLALCTKSVGKIKNFNDLYEAYYWRMRCLRHERWKVFSKFIIKNLALSLLKRSNIYLDHIKRYKIKPYIEKLDKPYKTTCYKLLKGEYNTDVQYYIMRMSVAEYCFWGNSEYEIYCKIIKRFTVDEFQYPFCVKGGLLGKVNKMINCKNDED